MFTITCSSVGDIIAVAQLILSLVTAFKESTGAAQDYRDFVYELETLASVIIEVARRVSDSSDAQLRDTILDDIRHCCSDLERASKLTSGFESLLHAHALGARTLSRGAKKLRWHFMKSAEADRFTERFHNWRSLIHLRITLLNDSEKTEFRIQQQRAHTEANVALIRGDIVIISESLGAHQRELERQLRSTNDASRYRTSLVTGSLRRMEQDLERHGRIILENSEARAQEEGRPQLELVHVIFPVCVLSFAFILANPAFVSPGNPLPSAIPWLALGVIAIHSLLYVAPVPRAVEYSAENCVIFIDFVGETMKLPPQLCDTMEGFCRLLNIFFSKEKRKGWSFVHSHAYEIIESSSSTVLDPVSWPTLVVVGTKIQLGALIRRMGSGILCPYCGIEVFQGLMGDESRDWIFCDGCRRTFQASTTREDPPGRRPSSPEIAEPPNEYSHHADTFEATGCDEMVVEEALPGETIPQEQGHNPSTPGRLGLEEPVESIEGFELIHVLHVIMESLSGSSVMSHPIPARERLSLHPAFASRPRAPDRMYSAELSSAYQRGYPLFDPQPDSTQRPVEIGDVGYIKPVHGCFVRLFNVHLEPGADGQPARDRLPDNFEPLPKGEVRRSELPGMNLFISDTVKSPEIYEHASKTLFGSSFRFSASAKCGAILVTPDPVIICLDSLSFKSFEDYVKANIRNWERFVANREKVHDKIDLQDLVLVTGVDRTTSWANVAFSDFLEAGFSLEVQFAGGTEIACRYNWRNTAKALTKFGPSNLRTSEITVAPTEHSLPQPGPRPASNVAATHQGDALRPINTNCDQTIFVRYIRAKRHWKLLSKKYESVARPAELALQQAQRDDVNEDAYMTADEGSEADFDTVTVPENGEFTDCLEPALNYILQHSDAEIAIAHNDDLATLSTENPSHKLPIGVVDDAGTFPRTDPTVQGSPLTALDLETRTSQRRATKTATRPV